MLGEIQNRLLQKVVLSIVLCSSAAHSAEKPNIVFLLADDLGIGDVQCYGGDRCQIETPHLDALARGGLQFTDAHVNASVCVPSRIAIMTGRYPWRFGAAQPGGAWGFLGPQFDAETFTLGKMLQGAGYRTGYVGKWHLGTVMVTKDGNVQNEKNVDYTRPLTVGPPQYGFDESFILPGSLDMYPYAFVRNNQWQGQVTAQKGWSAFNRVGPAAKDFEDHEVLETFYREAESFIKEQNRDKPFFLYLALTAPHTPISPNSRWQGKSKLGIYGDFVTEVDHAIDRVLTSLKENGLYDNTLVIFSSDHGAAPYAGNVLQATPGQIRLLERKGHYSSGPYRGYKFSVYEGGLRVPLIAHWPGRIQPGGQCDELVGLCDVMATFSDVAGGNIDPHDAPDSVSFAELLKHPQAEGRRRNLIMQSIDPFAVRDGEWKLCLCPGSGSRHNYGNEPTSEKAWNKAIARLGRRPHRDDLSHAPFVQLFNLAENPNEDHNLASVQPNRVAAMIELLRKQIANGRSTPGPDLSNGRDDISIHQGLPEFVQKQL